MKKICVLLASVFLFFASNAFAAITINVYDSTDTTNINNWKTNLGGIEKVLEDFEDIPTGWYQNTSTGVGTFTAGGEIGLGSSSYNKVNNLNSSDPYFRIFDQENFGREGQNYLDSADISELTLDITPNLTNLWFYIQDPSDIGADTNIKVGYGSNSLFYETIEYKQDNSKEFFVGISVTGDGQNIKQLIWETTDAASPELAFQDDGYRIDNFSTAVPIPGAALLLASGLLGLGWVKKRS